MCCYLYANVLDALPPMECCHRPASVPVQSRIRNRRPTHAKHNDCTVTTWNVK